MLWGGRLSVAVSKLKHLLIHSPRSFAGKDTDGSSITGTVPLATRTAYATARNPHDLRDDTRRRKEKTPRYVLLSRSK